MQQRGGTIGDNGVAQNLVSIAAAVAAESRLRARRGANRVNRHFFITACCSFSLCHQMQDGESSGDGPSENETIPESDHATCQQAAADETDTDDSHYHLPVYDGCTISVGAAITLIMTLT